MKQSSRIATVIFFGFAHLFELHYFPSICSLFTQLHLTFNLSQNATLSTRAVPWIPFSAAADVSASFEPAVSTVKTAPVDATVHNTAKVHPLTIDSEQPKKQDQQPQYHPTLERREEKPILSANVVPAATRRKLQIRAGPSWTPQQNVDKIIPDALSHLGRMAQSAAALLKSTTERGVSAMQQTDTFKSLRRFFDDRDVPSRQQFAGLTRTIGIGIVQFLFRVDTTAPEVREKLLELYALQLRSPTVSVISKYERVLALDDCATAFFHLEDFQAALMGIRAQVTQKQPKQLSVAPNTREHFLVEGKPPPQQQPSMYSTSGIEGGSVHVGISNVNATLQNQGVSDPATENTSEKIEVKVEAAHLAEKRKIIPEQGRNSRRLVSVEVSPTKRLNVSGRRELPKALYVMFTKLIKDLEVELAKHVSFISNSVMEIVNGVEALKLYVRRMLPRLKKVVLTAWDLIETSNLLPDVDQRHRLWILADFIWDLKELDEVLFESSKSIPTLSAPFNPVTYYYGTPSVTRAEIQVE